VSDIQLDAQGGLSFDITMENNDLKMDDSLKTAIIISLFTDRRVTVDELPDGESDLRGWWADALNGDGDQIGSKLWTLKREKITEDLLARAKRYCEEALQWLVEDEIAESVHVVTERRGLYQISIGIQIKRPYDDRIKYRFGFIWER